MNIRKGAVNRFRTNEERRILQGTQNRREVIPEFYYPGTLQKAVLNSFYTITNGTFVNINISPNF